MSFAVIDTAAGPVQVTHRLALAVQLVDVVQQRPVPAGLRVGIETPRSVAAAVRAEERGSGRQWPAVAMRDHGGGDFVLGYGPSVGTSLRVRVDDPARRWVPRRLSVDAWPLTDVEAVDGTPPGEVIPAMRRVVRIGLLPGAAYPSPGGVTGAFLTVVRDGAPVPWARVLAVTTAGRVGWGHGDEHGEVTVFAHRRDGVPDDRPRGFPVALRISYPDPQAPPPPPPPPGEPARPALPLSDRLRSVPLEPTAMPTAPQPPTDPPDLDTDVALGFKVPDGYVNAPQRVVAFRVGAIRRIVVDVPHP